MKQRAANELEFYEILKRLKHYCPEVSYELIDSLCMGKSISEINIHFTRLNEMNELMSQKGSISDITAGSIQRLQKLEISDFILECDELGIIRRNLRLSRDIKKFFSNTQLFSELRKYFSDLFFDAALLKELDAILNKHDELREDATPDLKRIFRAERSAAKALESFYSKMFKASKWSAMFMEQVVTFRNGRKVVLIKKEFKNRFPGVIHGESATGETVFMEPLEALQQNNKLRELELEKEHEISRILHKISLRLSGSLIELKQNQRYLAYWEFLIGLCSFMELDKTIIPSINNNKSISISKARHPLLKNDAIPIDLRLGDGYSTLVISGPNAGGKTVALKTTGLFVIMAMCGLPVYADLADICWVKKIFVDIGDKQSIENNLSTFTSHVKNLLNIIKRADDESLILVDEIGSGSSPEESQALACSILEELSKKGSLVEVTTHYRGVIELAEKSDEMMNASLEFDHERLSPTYKIIYGKPGFSFGLKIAEKYGLPDYIIERAREYIDITFLGFNEKVRSLEIKEAKAREIIEEYSKSFAKLTDKSKDLSEKIKNFKVESKEKIRRLLEQKEKELDSIKEELRIELKKISLNRGKGEHRLRKKINDYKEIIINEKREGTSVRKDLISISKTVKIFGSNTLFTVASISEDKLFLTAGKLKIKCTFDDVVQVLGERKTINRDQANISSNIVKKKASFREEIDVRGKRREEALDMVEKLISDALAVNHGRIGIIHGRGTYILKNSIRDLLKSNKRVKDFYDAEYNDGGTGKTIVKLK